LAAFELFFLVKKLSNPMVIASLKPWASFVYVLWTDNDNPVVWKALGSWVALRADGVWCSPYVETSQAQSQRAKNDRMRTPRNCKTGQAKERKQDLTIYERCEGR
jgi:hypothetical protein